MKVKEGFVLRVVAGQAIVIATGEASKEFRGMIKLNGTGELLWHGLEQGKDETQLVEALCAEYDVDAEQAARDVAAFVQQMADEGFLE